ncbi:hypothetical protein FFK22_024760 [Mycobacterium sp. KBS0706]|uniref:hypothetical protein n=1 Tax=Mycobacterium sp. KBS0706 TaxID=2578109 RepID=UPI00110FC9BB|nr:hypothetical protein [Mycobacterium sp. KBS0706]TSD86033.1 hypothetical protein FFK22_024760 [Mycobacterium sp. KBS0706]
MKRTKKSKPQITLALPLDPAAPNAELEAAVRAAEASFLAKAKAEAAESPSDAAPSNAEPVILPQAPVFVAARLNAETKTPEYVDAARSGRNTLYVVTAVKWGEMQAKKGKRIGWQRLPDTGFKAKGQALRAAEQMVEAGRATGAMAVQQTADPDAGDYDEPVILASFGRLPEGFAEI